MRENGKRGRAFKGICFAVLLVAALAVVLGKRPLIEPEAGLPETLTVRLENEQSVIIEEPQRIEAICSLLAQQRGRRFGAMVSSFLLGQTKAAGEYEELTLYSEQFYFHITSHGVLWDIRDSFTVNWKLC